MFGGKKTKHKGDGEIRQEEAGCSVKYSSEKTSKRKRHLSKDLKEKRARQMGI